MIEEKHKLQVLIIDDEVDICYLLKGILRYKNVEAQYVTSLEAAKTLLTEEDPPVIFLDNHLKDGFGIDQITYFKDKYPNSKLVMITAHDTALDREKAYKAGADFFISKPFSREIIINTIERIGLLDATHGEKFPH